MKECGPAQRGDATEAGEETRGTPAERGLILGFLALPLVVVPSAFRYARSSAGLNEIGCAVAIGALLPLIWRAERWFAQPTMIVGLWLLLSTLIFRHTDVSSLTDLLVGSFVVMASTNRDPPNRHLRSVGGGRRWLH